MSLADGLVDNEMDWEDAIYLTKAQEHSYITKVKPFWYRFVSWTGLVYDIMLPVPSVSLSRGGPVDQLEELL